MKQFALFLLLLVAASVARAQTGASQLNTIQMSPAGAIPTGAVSRQVQAKLNDSINVRDFGAVCDGVTDDTAAVKAAITYAISVLAGADIHLPGNCGVLASIDVPRGVTLYGDRGPAASGIIALPGFVPSAFSVPVWNGVTYNCPSTGTTSCGYVVKVGNYPPYWPLHIDLHYGGLKHLQVNANLRVDIGVIGDNLQEMDILEDVLVTQYRRIGISATGQNFDMHHLYEFGSSCNSNWGCLKRWTPGVSELYTGPYIVDSNGHIQKVTSLSLGGVWNYGGTTEPTTWSTTGGTTVDNNITWTDQGKVWLASHAYAFGDVVLLGNGHYQRCTLAGTSGTTEPAWSSTWGSVTDGTATWHDEGTAGQVGISLQGPESRVAVHDVTISNGGMAPAIEIVTGWGVDINNVHAEWQSHQVYLRRGGSTTLHSLYGNISVPILLKVGDSTSDQISETHHHVNGGAICIMAVSGTSSCDGTANVQVDTGGFYSKLWGGDTLSTGVGQTNITSPTINTKLLMGFGSKIQWFNTSTPNLTIDGNNFVIASGQTSAGTGIVFQSRQTWSAGGTLFNGGGIHVQGNCGNNGTGGASWASCGTIDFGATTDGGTWTARGTSGNGISVNGGTMYLWANTGLTNGNVFGPTVQMAITPTGINLPTLSSTSALLGYTAGGRVYEPTPAQAITVLGSGSAPTSNIPLAYDGTKLISKAKQTAVTTVSGSAGTTYTTTEQGIINNLVTAVNALIARLQSYGIDN